MRASWKVIKINVYKEPQKCVCMCAEIPLAQMTVDAVGSHVFWCGNSHSESYCDYWKTVLCWGAMHRGHIVQKHLISALNSQFWNARQGIWDNFNYAELFVSVLFISDECIWHVLMMSSPVVKLVHSVNRALCNYVLKAVGFLCLIIYLQWVQSIKGQVHNFSGLS